MQGYSTAFGLNPCLCKGKEALHGEGCAARENRNQEEKAELLNFQRACSSLRHCVNFFEHREEHSCYDEIKEGWLHP